MAGGQAGAPRVFYVTVGPEVNVNVVDSCTRQLPCRNFTAAMSLTDAGGEVIVLDSGGYGVVTINQSASIVAPPGVYAGITAFGGSNVAITIASTLMNAVVRLRGLTLNALGGLIGIMHADASGTSGNRLYIESCTVSGFSSDGMELTRNGRFYIHDSVVRENFSNGIWISGGAGTPSHASLRNVVLERNSQGVLIDNGDVAIRDSVATSNANMGFWAFVGIMGDTARVSIDSSQATHNQYGFYAGLGSGTAELFISGSVASMNSACGVIADNNGTVRVAHTTVTRNGGIGFSQVGSGVFESRGDNNVRGNFTDKSGTITTYAPE